MPAHLLCKLDSCRRARAVGVPVFHAHHIFVVHRDTICESERERLHRPIEGPPDVDDAVAGLREGGEFVREMVFDAREGGGGGLVDMHAGDGVAVGGGVCTADGVVEEEDALRAGDVLEDQAFDFGIVDLLDVVVVAKVVLLRWNIGEGGKGVVLQGKGRFFAANVLQRHVVLFVAKVLLGGAGGGFFDKVKGNGTVGGWGVEVEFCCDGTAGDEGGVLGRRVGCEG